MQIDLYYAKIVREMMLLKTESKNYVKSIQQTLFFDAYACLKNISCNQLTVRNRFIINSRNFATSTYIQVWKLWKVTVTHTAVVIIIKCFAFSVTK